MTRGHGFGADVAHLRVFGHPSIGGAGDPNFVLGTRAQVFAEVFQTGTLVDGLPTLASVDFEDVVSHW